ncbi:MAG TPA: helicase-exonuclease AddAB subunit AddB [Clostridiaceae bacterium]|nr:helicase-exonuclease AddAB subunit AddB [Clostridiaceae bacterium]
MSLRLIYGRAGSGKSRFCLDEIKSRLNSGQDRPLVLLVPEQFSLQAERNLIKTLGAEGILKAEVLSFRRMAFRVFSEVGGFARPHINASGKCMLIFRIIDELKDNLRVFSRSASQRGFVNTLLETISEMKRYNVSPEILEEVCNSAGENELLRYKLQEINLVYSEFERRLHQNYIDSDDDLTQLAVKLNSSRQFEGAEIWIDEFSGFTPQEYSVIEKLLKTAFRVSVCLCADCIPENPDIDRTDLFLPTKTTALKLLKIARKNNVKVEDSVKLCRPDNAASCPTRFKNSRELCHLEEQLFSIPYKIYPEETSDISIFAAANMRSEVEDTARDIIRLCREKGMRFRDIAVVCRNLDAYEKQISTVFAQYGISCFIDAKRDISKHPLVLLITSAFEIFINNWSYESVFRYLKTGLTNIDRESVDIIENYVLACGIKGGKWTQEEPWTYRMSGDFTGRDLTEYEQKNLSRVNEIREMIVKPLAGFRSKIKGRKKCIEICEALFDFLCSIDVPAKIEGRIEMLKQNGRLDLANEYSQVWNIIVEVLDQIVEVAGKEQMNLEQFKKMLEIGLSEYRIGLIPPALDQVLVGSVERSKSHEIKALYILGVNDGVFPSAQSGEGILSDREREALRSYGVELAQDSRTRAFEELYLVYTTLTNAGSYLRLSYPAADNEGKALRPSIIISRLRKIFPKIRESSDILSDDTGQDSLRLVSVPAPTFNELIGALRKQAEGFNVNPLWWDVYRWFVQDEEWKSRCSKAISGMFYSNRADALSPERAKKLYGNIINTSVSRLEQFASCPFSYYIRYGLKAKERKIYKLDTPDIGTFMHTVIDRFSQGLKAKKMSFRTLEKNWCVKEVSDIVDDMLAKAPGWILSSSGRYKFFAARMKRIITRSIWLISEHIKRGNFEPAGYEIVFGDGGDFPPIVVELPSGEKVYLTGRIDRVDVLSAEEGLYLRIVDYKSGGKSFKLSDVYNGLQIQLITYLDAMLSVESRSGKPLLPGGIFYVKLDDPIIKGDRESDDEAIEEAIIKQLKMKGLLLADVKLVKEMDRQIEGDSSIIPARINKGDVLGRASAATLEQFGLLRKYVRRLLAKMGEEILNGEISIKPYKKKNTTACDYCRYLSICQFDTRISGNRYRLLRDLKDDEVWEMIRDEGSEVDQ